MARYKLQVHGDADYEFDKFVNRDRSTAYDAGSLFRVLEEIVENGLSDWFAPLHTESGCQLHMFSGNGPSMFVAANGQTMLLVQLSELGKEGGRALPTQAIERMKGYFGI